MLLLLFVFMHCESTNTLFLHIFRGTVPKEKRRLLWSATERRTTGTVFGSV